MWFSRQPRRAVSLLGLALAIGFLLGNWSIAQESESRLRPLEIEDALGTLAFPGLTPIALSPDGELVAYTLQSPKRRADPTKDERFLYYSPTGAFVESVGCDIYISDTRTGQTTNLTGERGTSWAPAWSPDGQRLAFYSDRTGTAQLWIWERSSRQLREASAAIVRPFFNFELPRWSPDGTLIVLKVLPEDLTIASAADLIIGSRSGEEESHSADFAAGASTVRLYRSSPSQPSTSDGDKPRDGLSTQLEVGSWSNRYLADLAVVEAHTGRTRRLVKRAKPLGYWFSPDGREIAFTTFMGIMRNTQQSVFDLAVVDLDDSSLRVVTPAVLMEYGRSVSWSPDGSTLAYTTDGQRAEGASFVVSRVGGQARQLRAEGRSFSDDHRAPLWDPKGRYVYLLAAGSLWRGATASGIAEKWVEIPSREIREIVAPAGGGRYWSPDAGRTMYVTTRDNATKRVGIYRLDLERRQATAVVEEAAMYGGIFQIDTSPDTLVYTSQDTQHPADLWVADRSFTKRRRLTHSNPSLDRYTFGTSQLIEWQARNGATIRGALLLPPNFREGVRVPLVVNVYGGSTLSDNVNRFGLGPPVDNLQLLATRGYAVLSPDTSLGVGTPMRDIADTVLPGVAHLVSAGIADPQRLGVMGHSYGGYSTLALIVQTTEFRAAVVNAGKADLIASYGQMSRDGTAYGVGWSETGQGRMGGTPWEYQSRYIQNSPIHYLDRVETPVLLVHGELDATVPVWLADQVFVALRRLGKEVTYARYDGEEHWRGTWSHANAVDNWNRVLAWFDQHLGAKNQ